MSIVSPTERPREPESNDNSYSQTLHSRAEECCAVTTGNGITSLPNTVTMGPVVGSIPNGQNVQPQVLHRSVTLLYL